MKEETKRCEVLWETTWRQVSPWSESEGIVRTFRVVAWRFSHEDWKIGALHYEELYPDCMGVVGWHLADEDRVPAPVMVRLLQQAGAIGPDEDLSCVDC